MSYASGKEANAICDICSFPCDYTELKDYIYNQRPNGWRVCPTCLDIDQEQLQIGKYPKDDPQALRNPRPDSAELPDARGFFGWQPVLGLLIQVRMGVVTVTTS